MTVTRIRAMGSEIQTTPCKICGLPTPYLETKLCNRCWQLQTRIRQDPEIARKILEGLGK